VLLRGFAIPKNLNPLCRNYFRETKMKFIFLIIARGLQISGMCSLPFALYFGETEKSMSIELKYLLMGSILFYIGYLIDTKFVKA
jgi:hypothetical protein